jgi:hypothetical protein
LEVAQSSHSNSSSNASGNYLVEYNSKSRTAGTYKFKVTTRQGEIITNGVFSVAVGKFYVTEKSEIKFHRHEVFIGEQVFFEIYLRGMLL